MTSQEGNPAGKKSWLVIGGLAVALAGVGYVAMQGPISGKDVSGSIVPAERYRADDAPKQDIVKLHCGYLHVVNVIV